MDDYPFQVANSFSGRIMSSTAVLEAVFPFDGTPTFVSVTCEQSDGNHDQIGIDASLSAIRVNQLDGTL